MVNRKDSSLVFADWLYAKFVDATFYHWGTRRKLTRAVLVIMLLMNFRTFEYFPGFRPLQELWYGLTLATFIILYPLTKIALDWTFTRVELYMLLVLPVLFVLPAFTAHAVFAQPIFYGIFPQRSALPVLWWILLINAWKLRWFDASDVEAALVFLIWSTFLLFNSMRWLLNPNRFTTTGFTVGSGSDATFTLTAFFAAFGVLYYAFYAIRQRRAFYYVLALLNLISAVGHSGRSLMVSILASVLIFLVVWRGPLKALPAIGGFICAIAVAIAVGSVVSPTATGERVSKFVDAFRVATGASEVQDVSANARIYESQTAKPYVEQHPLLGVGAVSAQWEGGLVAAVGEYFVPGDIGFLGIIFTYGFFGLAIFSGQYLFASRYVSGAAAVEHTRLIDSTRGFILFTLLYSSVTGLFVFNIELTSFFVILLTLLCDGRPATAPSPVSASFRQTSSAVALARS